MILKTYKLIFLSLTLMLSINTFSQENLDRYLETAAENNPGLKSIFSEYMAAMEKVPQVGTLPDPTVAFAYFIEPAQTKVGPQEWKFNLAQSFPWFGLLKAKENVATKFANAKFEAFENTKSNLFFEVKTAYYNYYFIEKAIAITKENIEILEIFKRLSLVKIEAGAASVVDELRVELELNDLGNQLELFIDTKFNFQVKFNNLLNRNRNEHIVVPELLWQDEFSKDKLNILDEIYAANHELKSIDYKFDAFLNQEIVAKKEGMPKFTIGLTYNVIGKDPASSVSNNGQDSYVFPSIGLKIPLYRKKYKALIKEAQFMQDVQKSKKENKKNLLSAVFENTFKDFSDGNRRIGLNKRQSNIAKKVLDLLITDYSTNSKDFEEVLRIERQLLKYKLAHQKAITDKNAAVAFMNYLTGK